MLQSGDLGINDNIRVCVIGLGRIGLPLAASLANSGYDVAGLELNESIVKKLNLGNSHITDEPGLADMVKSAVSSKKLSATTNTSAIGESNVIIICVSTPVDEARHPEYKFVVSASETISRHLRRNSLVMIESTVGPGTVENLIIPILEKSGLKAGKDFYIASTPERANPGEVLKNLQKDYKIVGGIDDKSTELAKKFYSVVNNKIVTVSSPKAANAVKLTENIYRNVNIALMNELAMLYGKMGIDTHEIIKACSTKWNFLPHYPGPGVGGPCLPANPYYLIEEAIKVKYVPHLMRMADEINARMPQHVIEITSSAMNGIDKPIRGSKITVLGLSYKANVADTQISPSEQVINMLGQMGAKVSAYDPHISGKIFGVDAHQNLKDAVRNSDCLIFMVDHDDFKDFDLKTIKNDVSKSCALVDCRGLFKPQQARELGFKYAGVGRV